MQHCYLELYDSINNNLLQVRKKILNKIIKSYKFISVSVNSLLDQDQEINKNLKKSKIIVINQGSVKENCFFIISFHQTLLYFDKELITLFLPLLTLNSEVKILFLSNSKEIFDQYIQIDYKEIPIHRTFIEEIKSFNEELKFTKQLNNMMKQIWMIVAPCISSYLIKQSYYKLQEDRSDIYNNGNSNLIIDDDEYINLRVIGNGPLSIVRLIYHIESENLFVVKQRNCFNPEIPKLKERELNNHRKLSHPFIPKFYGVLKRDNSLVLEFINGQTLLDIKQLHLSEKEKIVIILELILAIAYTHNNDFIYRDLKPNNVMIDENKQVVLIDFDRMIDIQYNSDDLTRDFASYYIAPEIENGEISNKSDIYSLGKMIYYIINETDLRDGEIIRKNDFIFYSDLLSIINECLDLNPKKRPSANMLFLSVLSRYIEILCNNLDHLNVLLFLILREISSYLFFRKNYQDFPIFIEYLLNIVNNNYTRALYFLGCMYYEGKHIKPDINKAIFYMMYASVQDPDAQYFMGSIFTNGVYVPFDIKSAIYLYQLASLQNESNSQNNLGCIYYDGIGVPKNVNKSIYYFTLAANNGNTLAQKNLGVIYYKLRDIKKSINYFSLAADNNHEEAQCCLGIIYYKGEHVNQDIKKSIHYFSLAANNNHAEAQYCLGMIYYKGKHVNQDIKKSINYFSLAADNNHEEAQYFLGFLYYEGEHVNQDIKKSIHYFSLAANNNHAEAQYCLGMIYYKGKHVNQDIKKSINYFSLAADNNHEEAQYFLGFLYYEGEHVNQDIKKSIHYFSLAADNNHEEAQYKLGYIYDFMEFDINKALQYYTLAANQNNMEAQFNLGILYYEGIKVARNINKAIYYFTLAANQNDYQSQHNLGHIYFENVHIPQDINRAIHYYLLAANQNDSLAQFSLGLIYSKPEYRHYDIRKAINYYTLSANQNNQSALINLGNIFLRGKGVPCDFQKAIYYFTLAAKLFNPEAQFNLGVIYLYGLFAPYDINKAIHYFSLASNLGFQKAQYFLGCIYLFGYGIEKNVKKGIFYLTLSSKGNVISAHYILGSLYHEGKYINCDIKKAIMHYKEASSFNNQYAKNNLGVIYKNGFGSEVEKNIGYAIELFKEAIKEKSTNDVVSKFNLASIYFNEQPINYWIDEAFDLLIQSAKQNFQPSYELLAMIIVKEFGSNFETVKEVIEWYIDDPGTIANSIYQIILEQKFNDPLVFDEKYKKYRTVGFVYNYHGSIFRSLDLQKSNKNNNSQMKKKISNLSTYFYEGFEFANHI